MDKYFKTKQGERVNIIEHILEQIEMYNNLTIRIGTDSHNEGTSTTYVTAIIFRYGTRGAHYIFYKEEVPRINTEYLRLYEEGVRTIEASELISREIPISIDGLEFDFADIKKTLSSKLVSGFRGWANAIHQKAIFKSGQMIATKAADHICRKY